MQQAGEKRENYSAYHRRGYAESFEKLYLLFQKPAEIQYAYRCGERLIHIYIKCFQYLSTSLSLVIIGVYRDIYALVIFRRALVKSAGEPAGREIAVRRGKSLLLYIAAVFKYRGGQLFHRLRVC